MLSLSIEVIMSSLAIRAEAGIPKLVPGPRWPSFEQFRKAGEASLDDISEHAVATLVAKRGTYRILREPDFQQLQGVTAEIRRFQNGINIVIRAARAYAKHSDKEHSDLLLESISLITNTPVLPTFEGHERVMPDAVMAEDSDDFDWETAVVPRPAL